MTGTCPYDCLNKTEFGYCRSTGCINPRYAQMVLEYREKEPERKIGRWKQDESFRAICSECGEPCATYVLGAPRDRFCKMCGAKMGEGD